MIRRPAAAPPAPAAPPPTAAPRTIAPALQDEGEFSDEATMIRRPAAAPPAPAAPPPTAAPRTIAPALQDETEFSDEATMIRRPAVSPPVAAAQPARSAGAHAANAEVQAFLEGAGLTALDIPDAQAFMRSSGMMIRAAIEGFMTLLLAREEARKEIGAATADPEATGNPLKLIADPLEFAAFLFDPKRPIIGDVDPVQAFGDACSDLRSHQAALLESIRAAAIAALDRVDPKKIEREHGTNLGGLNLTRKSKLWDLAIAQHEKFSREVESNLNSAVGQEVLAAYMARVSKHRGR